jgi:glycosyltransferase involved in cell wall biosynthesis
MSCFDSLVYDFKVLIFELSFHPSVAWTLSLGLFLVSMVLRPFMPSESFVLLSRSHLLLTRIGRHGFVAGSLYHWIERVICRRVATTSVMELVESKVKVLDINRPRIAGLVLKVPRYEEGCIVEKGALLLNNTDRFDSFRRSVDMRCILQRYVLILEPSWSGYTNLKLLSFTSFREDQMVVMSPYSGDYRFLKHLQSNLHPVTTGNGDWVDPRIFRPLEPQEKQYDAVMIARWSLDKRHHALFRALRVINDPSFRVALLALANNVFGTDRASILRMIERLRLGKQITVFEDLPHSEVNVVLNQSRVNVLLSRQEGGNRALFEGFFAGIPGLAFSNHVGIPTTHFVPQTGRLIDEHELPNALRYFRDHWKEFDPRPWALANIAPEASTAKLNLVLKELAIQRGEPWTQDIVAKCNAPDVRYYPDERVAEGFCTANELMACFPRDPSFPPDPG